MKIAQTFRVARPLPVVKALFQDIPVVASLMPGAELTQDLGGGRYTGRVGIKLGPFNASFDGEAEVRAAPDGESGHVEGKGIDKRGGSRSRLLLDYTLAGDREGTDVTIDADIQLSGPVAQFGRTGIVNETAALLIAQFVKNIEERLAVAATPSAHGQTHPKAPPSGSASQRVAPANQISGFALLKSLLASFFRRLFAGRST
jgi:carbon monoxide dehydrogenase subunit G